MNEKNIFTALNDIAPALIERAAPNLGAKKAKKRIRPNRWATLAACFCLIIAISVVAFMNIPVLGDGSIPLWGAKPQANTLQFYGDKNSVGSSLGVSYAPMGISVTAELVEMLPDTYTFYDDWNQREYGLLRLRTVKLLKGREMTEEFYYLIPTGYMTDYTIYDKFVITDMAQCGYEYFAMYNKTTGEAERFDEVLFCYGTNSYATMGGEFIAFDENGYIDRRLWNSTDLWKKSTESRNPPNTLDMAEKTAAVPIYKPAQYAYTIKEMDNETKKVLDEYISFENGVYVPNFNSKILSYCSTNGASASANFSARRYINGFATNETVSIGASSYTCSKAQFTESDLAALPNLAAAMTAVARAFDKGYLAPPHIEEYENKSLRTYGIFGWYAKTENGVVGIIRVNWDYYGKYDDAYYIVECGEKTCRPIDRDDLLEIMGEYENPYIYTGKYDSDGKDFQMFGV